MHLKLTPYNTLWQWKVIQGERAQRHIATLDFGTISEDEFTLTICDRAFSSSVTEKLTLDWKAQSARIERTRTEGEKAARLLSELWRNGELSRLMPGWTIAHAELAGELTGH